MTTRRSILGGTAGLAMAGLATAQPKPPVGIGFLGITHSHGEGKLGVALASPDYRVIGVADESPGGQAIARKAGVAVLPRAALLANPDVRVIAVESPVRSHALDAMDALRADKHVHVEKPPSSNLADFQKMVELARQKKLLLQMGYMWRYHPGITSVLEAAKSGWLGNVFELRGAMSSQIPAERRPEWAEFPGGHLFELACHMLDPMVRLMGKPSKVTPFLRNHGRLADSLNDHTVVVLEWPSATGIVQGSTMEVGASRQRIFEIHGTNGYAVVQPVEPPSMVIELASAAGPYQKGMNKVPMPAYKRYVADFVDLAAAVRGETSIRVTNEEDLLVHEVLLEASGMLR